MKAYVESNFLLELAVGQEEASAAERILGMAEAREIEIAIPTFALIEPFSTISRRAKERKRLAESLSVQLQQLSRSKASKAVAEQFSQAPTALIEIAGLEFNGLRAIVYRLLVTSRVIPLNATTFHEAQRYEQTYGIDLPDAIIYASVISDLKTAHVTEPKCFVSRNYKHFRDQAIEQELQSFGCRYIERFADAVNFLAGSSLR